MRVLIIDDSKTIREIVKIYLMNEHLSFEEASDGEAGLVALKRGTFDLVLADYKMPKLDGLGLLNAVRADPMLGKVPIIMLTGEKQPELRQAVLEAGATEVLNKPISATALQASIQKVRERR